MSEPKPEPAKPKNPNAADARMKAMFIAEHEEQYRQDYKKDASNEVHFDATTGADHELRALCLSDEEYKETLKEARAAVQRRKDARYG